VAHELNSPLGAIALMVDAALRQLDRPEQARSKLERAQQACERARLIVQRLLEEARHPGPLVQPFRLDDCLREGLPFVEEQLNRAGIELVTFWSDNPTMQGQSSTVQQVMINLLLNAAEAVGPGGRIELATYPWGFSVSDWGPGIPEEVAERIFEPFFTTRSGGNGLGLWICQDLLRQQRGAIRLVQGPPTRFEVHLMSAASGSP
jgi:signal transduction histidine kinase